MSIALERRRYMGASEDIQFVDYIYGDGNSYINTGVVPTANTDWEITTDGIMTDGGQILVSSAYYRYIKLTSNKVLAFVGKNSQNILSDYNGKSLITANVTDNKFYVNNELFGTISFVAQTNPLLILGGNYSGTYYISAGYVHGCKIWEDGTLIRNFVPALSDGEYGLYDKVNDTFYGSATSTPFSGGGV